MCFLQGASGLPGDRGVGGLPGASGAQVSLQRRFTDSKEHFCSVLLETKNNIYSTEPLSLQGPRGVRDQPGPRGLPGLHGPQVSLSPVDQRKPCCSCMCLQLCSQTGSPVILTAAPQRTPHGPKSWATPDHLSSGVYMQPPAVCLYKHL